MQSKQWQASLSVTESPDACRGLNRVAGAADSAVSEALWPSPIPTKSKKIMKSVVTANTPSRSWSKKLIQFPLMHMIFAIFFVALPAGLTMSLGDSVGGENVRIMWPQFLATIVALVAYWVVVRWTEKRPVTELSGRGAATEFTVGLLTGALMVASVIGVLFATGVYQQPELNGWSATVLIPFAEMLFVGVLEEVLCRGIVFRIAEKSVGTWAALIIVALLFGLAHAPGSGVGFWSISIAVVAGASLTAAYIMTRRLWLCIGIHVAWNYTLGSIFSVAVSGRQSRGLLTGKLIGPEWVTGGTYGLEASVLTLVAFVLVGGYFLWRANKAGNFIRPAWQRLTA